LILSPLKWKMLMQTSNWIVEHGDDNESTESFQGGINMVGANRYSEEKVGLLAKPQSL
jgi:hypothetical protein